MRQHREQPRQQTTPQEQLREQQYRSQQSSAGTAKSTAGSNVAGAVATKIQPQSRENTEAAAKVEKSTAGNVPAQTTNDARQEQLRERQYHIRPQTDPQELQRLTAAKKRAEDAWSNWTWEKEYNPNDTTNLEDFYRRAGIRLPPGRVFSGRIPTVEQLYELVRQGQSEKPSAEAAQRGQELRRKQETETLYANMDREWAREEATHQDIGFAREEQLAARKYQEKKEREQKAYDLSTQAVVDEKLAMRAQVAIQSNLEYTKSVWDRVYGVIDKWSQNNPSNKELLNQVDKWVRENIRTTSAAQNGWTDIEDTEQLFHAFEDFFQSRKSEYPMQFQFVVDTDTEMAACTLIHLGNISKDVEELLALGTTGIVAKLAGKAATAQTAGVSAVLGAAVGAACLATATIKGVSLASELVYTIQDEMTYQKAGQVIVTMGIESKSPVGKIAYALF